MKKLLYLVLFMLIGALIIGVGILIGSNASWYFAWILGTALFVALLAGSVMLFDQEDEAAPKLPHKSD